MYYINQVNVKFAHKWAWRCHFAYFDVRCQVSCNSKMPPGSHFVFDSDRQAVTHSRFSFLVFLVLFSSPSFIHSFLWCLLLSMVPIHIHYPSIPKRCFPIKCLIELVCFIYLCSDRNWTIDSKKWIINGALDVKKQCTPQRN